MISQQRKDNLDYYFYFDHQARRNNLVKSVAAGFCVLAISQLLASSKLLAFSLGALAASGVLTFAVSTYEKTKVRKGSSAKNKARTLASSSKRTFIFQISTVAAALGIFGFLPQTSEAEGLNRRIRYFIASSRLPEARELARTAATINVPVNVDLSIALTGSGTSSPQSALQANDRQPASASMEKPFRVETGTRETLLIAAPVVHLDSRRFLINYPLTNTGRSMIGGGPTQSVLFTDSGDSAILECEIGPSNDLLFFGIGFAGLPGTQGGRSTMVAYTPRIGRKMAIVNASVESLEQVIDAILWEDVVFQNCTILLKGGPIRFTRVTFSNCDFQFATGITEEISRKIRSHASMPITISAL